MIPSSSFSGELKIPSSPLSLSQKFEVFRSPEIMSWYLWVSVLCGNGAQNLHLQLCDRLMSSALSHFRTGFTTSMSLCGIAKLTSGAAIAKAKHLTTKICSKINTFNSKLRWNFNVECVDVILGHNVNRGSLWKMPILFLRGLLEKEWLILVSYMWHCWMHKVRIYRI